jgi:hypothetical protein
MLDMEETPTKTGRKSRSKYHQAAVTVLKFYLREYLNNGDLTLTDEYLLSESPLKVDMMVIKKNRGVTVERDDTVPQETSEAVPNSGK